MMNKSLRGADRESSDKRGYGFRGSFLGIQPERDAKSKKRAAGKPAALKVDNREASNRVDRSHSVSKRGQFQVIKRKA
jgi:hypothetical protein